MSLQASERPCSTAAGLNLSGFFFPKQVRFGVLSSEKGGPRWLDGWAGAKGLGSRWAPFMFPFWAAGSDGWAAARGWVFVGLLHVSFLGSWVGWVGRGQEAGLSLGSLHTSFLGGWVGWVGRGQRAGLPLSSLHVSFLGSWGGWVGRGQESRLMFPSFGVLGSLPLPFWAAGSDGWAAAKKLGSRRAPFFLGPGSDGSAAAKKLGYHDPSPAKQHKRLKQDPSAHPPGFSHFTLTDNGGQGDCAYLAIAIALADANKAKSKTPAVSQDFEPGGRLQAQLRLLACKELANNPSRYFAPGDDRASTVPSQTASAGVWADSVSLSALCQASQVELRIWGFSAKENRWALYFLSPFKTTH